MNTNADMRASDADRDAVLSDLSEHFQAGRLTVEEFEDRAGRTLAARTWGELTALLRDLPSTRPGPRAAAGAAAPAGTAVPPGAAGPAARPQQPHQPQRPPVGWAPAPVAVLAAIAIAVAVSGGLAHAHWGVLWLVLPGLFIARRLMCHAGPSGRYGSGD